MNMVLKLYWNIEWFECRIIFQKTSRSWWEQCRQWAGPPGRNDTCFLSIRQPWGNRLHSVVCLSFTVDKDAVQVGKRCKWPASNKSKHCAMACDELMIPECTPCLRSMQRKEMYARIREMMILAEPLPARQLTSSLRRACKPKYVPGGRQSPSMCLQQGWAYPHR